MPGIETTLAEIDLYGAKIAKLYHELSNLSDEVHDENDVLSPMAEEHYLTALLHLSLAMRALRLAKLNFERNQ